MKRTKMLELLCDYPAAERFNPTGQWQVAGELCTRPMEWAIKQGYVDTHFPHNTGFAQINQFGRDALAVLRKRENAA